MRQVPFTVIYHDGTKYRHKQVRGYHAFCVKEDFIDEHPGANVMEVFCGRLPKMTDRVFQIFCKKGYETEA